MNNTNNTANHNKKPSSAALKTGIESDCKTCARLLELLQEERTLLQDKQLEALDKLIQEKAQLLTRLEHSAIARSQWVQQYQRSNPNKAHVDDIFEEITQAQDVHKHWQTLKDLYAQCQSTNEANGKIMVRSQATYSRLMTILRGQSQQSSLYTHQGNTGKGAPGQSIGHA